MDSCIFCDIVAGLSPGEIHFEDEQTLVLKDINPVNKFHYLAIPKEHITGEQDLLPKHRELVERLIRNGKKVMSQIGADMEDIIYGFHRLPFLTVPHLHLHFVSPKTNLYFDEDVYEFNTPFFISAVDVLIRLGEGIAASPAVEEDEEEQLNGCAI